MAVARKRTSGSSSTASGNTLLLENKQCDSGVIITDWVYLDEDLVFQKASASDIATGRAVGVVKTKPTSTTANIVVGGETGDIFSALISNSNYFLALTLGEMDPAIVTGPGQVILFLGRPLSATNFLVKIGEPLIRA